MSTALLVGPNNVAPAKFDTTTVGNHSGSGDDLVGVLQGVVKVAILMKTKISMYRRV